MTRTNRESITFFLHAPLGENTRGGDRTHNLRLREPTRFHCATRACKSGSWSCWGSNPGPSPYQSDALPTELHDRCRGRRTQAVKGVDPKSTGLCPRRFESCRLRFWMRRRKATLGGTRTHNLWLREPTPYPLGYRGSVVTRPP